MFRTALANAPRSSGSLRPTRSLGALRSTAAAHASAIAVPPVPSRSLVSTVLLTRDSYDAKNVQQLKAECKQRGLTTNGKRADIVARLLNDDAKQSGSGLTTEASAPSMSQSRSNASLASLRGGKQQKQPSPAPNSSAKGTSKKPAPAPSKAQPATEASRATESAQPTASTATPTESSPSTNPLQQGASIPHPPSIKPGQVQHPGLQTSSAEGGVSSPDSKLNPSSNPPGVPPQNEPNVPETFKVEIPYEQPVPERGPEIPIVTAYTSNRGTAELTGSSSSSASSAPRVVTASDAADVLHALDLNASTEASKVADAASGAASSLGRSLKQDLGLTGDVTGQVQPLLKSTEGLRAKASQLTSAVFSDVTTAMENLSGKALEAAGSTSSTSTTGGKGSGRRPMNADEKRGLYVLGGLVFGGFTLGGLTKPKKEKH